MTIKQWMSYLSSFNVQDRDFERKKEELTKIFRQVPSDNDVIWALMNEAQLRLFKSGMMQEIKQMYYTQALFKYYENRGDYNQLLLQRHKMELEEIKKYGFAKEVEIKCVDNSCDTCKELAEWVYPVEEALKEMPLPCNKCTYKLSKKIEKGFCRCMYVPV